MTKRPIIHDTPVCVLIGPAADVRACDWLIQVMKRLMNIPTDFWLRYVNVDDDDDDVYEADDQQSAADGTLDSSARLLFLDVAALHKLNKYYKNTIIVAVIIFSAFLTGCSMGITHPSIPY